RRLGVARAERARVPVRLARVRVLVAREVPDAREPDDYGDDDEAHYRVVEHRERVERLPPRLYVLLVLRKLRPVVSDARHQPRPRARGCVRPTGPWPSRPGSYSAPSPKPPAASRDHGGDDTPFRTTR